MAHLTGDRGGRQFGDSHGRELAAKVVEQALGVVGRPEEMEPSFRKLLKLPAADGEDSVPQIELSQTGCLVDYATPEGSFRVATSARFGGVVAVEHLHLCRSC